VGSFGARDGERAMTEPKNHARNLDQRMLAFVDPIGRLLTDGFHILALFAIGGATVWAAAAAFYAMVQKGAATIEDLLLLFIYLEIGSMVGIYFRTTTCRCGSCSMSVSRLSPVI